VAPQDTLVELITRLMDAQASESDRRFTSLEAELRELRRSIGAVREEVSRPRVLISGDGNADRVQRSLIWGKFRVEEFLKLALLAVLGVWGLKTDGNKLVEQIVSILTGGG